MDIDILNDILNHTISNLFTNKAKHLTYLSEDTEESSNDYNSAKISQQKNKTNFSNVRIQDQEKESLVLTPESWSMTMGKEKLEESMKKLGIDESIAKGKDIDKKTLDQLIQEKSRVKNELKKYDNEFKEIFRRVPNHREKEVMKPLYLYYKTIKKAIERKENQKAYSSSTQNSNQQSEYSGISSVNSTLANISDVSNISTTNKTGHLSTNSTVGVNLNYNFSKNFALHKKSNSVNANSSHNNNSTVSDAPERKKRSLSKAEQEVLEKEFFDIKSEQSKLRETLHEYQNEFQRTNNRKVKYTSDIVPVKNEYNRYKSNKQRLTEIKNLLSESSKK